MLGVETPIRRRVQVPSGATLSRVHGDIQAVMGWWNSHLHQFEISDIRYSSPEPGYVPVFGDPVHDERKSKLGSLAEEDDRFIYEYDFGDSWEHEIVGEQILAAGPGSTTSRCLEGTRSCPPEDVGGWPGYADFLDAMADPRHPDHDVRREWIGGRWDPEFFSLDGANGALKMSASRRFR